jgi:type I restriction enzyme S subunit
LPVAVPPLREQCAIAHILGTLDDKIELNRRMNETLEAMARALFKSWFVDFDPVRAKAEGRDPGLPKPLADLFPDSFEDSELGDIPKRWTVWRVADIGSVICGKTPSTQVSKYYGDDVPFITIPDMHGKIFATATQKRQRWPRLLGQVFEFLK